MSCHHISATRAGSALSEGLYKQLLRTERHAHVVFAFCTHSSAEKNEKSMKK